MIRTALLATAALLSLSGAASARGYDDSDGETSSRYESRADRGADYRRQDTRVRIYDNSGSRTGTAVISPSGRVRTYNNAGSRTGAAVIGR